MNFFTKKKVVPVHNRWWNIGKNSIPNYGIDMIVFFSSGLLFVTTLTASLGKQQQHHHHHHHVDNVNKQDMTWLSSSNDDINLMMIMII